MRSMIEMAFAITYGLNVVSRKNRIQQGYINILAWASIYHDRILIHNI